MPSGGFSGGMPTIEEIFEEFFRLFSRLWVLGGSRPAADRHGAATCAHDLDARI